MEISRHLPHKRCLAEFPLEVDLTSLGDTITHKCFCVLPVQFFAAAASDLTQALDMGKFVPCADLSGLVLQNTSDAGSCPSAEGFGGSSAISGL